MTQGYESMFDRSLNIIVGRLQDNYLNCLVEGNVDIGSSFFVDTFTPIHAGRITVWNTLAIHAQIIDASTSETLYEHHGFIENEQYLWLVLDEYVAILKGDASSTLV
jgi:hypothetical protein